MTDCMISTLSKPSSLVSEMSTKVFYDNVIFDIDLWNTSPSSAESKKVVNLPPDNNIQEGKPSSQNNIKWACLGCVIEVFRGPSSGQ